MLFYLRLIKTVGLLVILEEPNAFNKLDDNKWKIISNVIKDPKDIYG